MVLPFVLVLLALSSGTSSGALEDESPERALRVRNARHPGIDASDDAPRGAAVGAPGRASSPPQRIVTLNLCADQLVVQLVDRPRIAAITWLALDPRGSVVAEEAAGLKTTYGTAEEVARLHPDLVIAGRYTTRTTVALLRRFGYRVMEIDTPISFAQIEAQIVEVANAVGARERGARLVEEMRARLAHVRAASHGTPLTAAVFGTDGSTQGTGTLTDEIIRASGLRNVAATLGVRGWGQVSLEQLLLSRPDFIILPSPGDGPISIGQPLSVGQQVLAHPALARDETASRSIRIPAKWLACGGPATVMAVEYLHRATTP